MQMPEKDMADFEKVVLAGMRLMYNEKTFGIFKQGMTRTDSPVPQRLASEAAGLMKMLYDKSNATMPRQIIAPAAAMLLMEMGKFMTEAGVAKVNGADIQVATGLLMTALKQMVAGQGNTEQPAQDAPPQEPATGGLMMQQQRGIDSARTRPMM